MLPGDARKCTLAPYAAKQGVNKRGFDKGDCKIGSRACWRLRSPGL